MSGRAFDRGMMAAALGLARRGLGQVWPNPAVGCILVKDGVVAGRGWTQSGGRPHAETEALARAGDAARGATAYVTLEPCAHHGKTGPCAEALVAAGISRCVVAMEDPDPRVEGRGLEVLRQAGIAVEVGLLADEAAEVNAGFLTRLGSGRPLVTLKTATSQDGHIATHAGESRWITGEGARAAGHALRASHDAVLVGARTAVMDDPQLTCRLPGMLDRSPIRIVADSRLLLSLTSQLVKTAMAIPTWVMTLEGNDSERLAAYAQAGVEIIETPADSDGHLDLTAGLRLLGDRGLTRLLVESGGRLAGALFQAGLVDRLAWFRAGLLLGGDGVPAVQGFGIERLADAVRLSLLEERRVGADSLEVWRVEP